MITRSGISPACILIWLWGALITATLHLLRASWRVDTQGLQQFDRMLIEHTRVLVVFWHGSYVPLFALLKQRDATVLVSDSFRGRVLAEVCRRFGYRGVVVTRDRHGQDTAALQAASASHTLALAADGPLGPLHVVKPGAVRFASTLGFAVVPAVAVGRRSWIAARRWDRMQIPCPFTRVALVIGSPIRIPADLDRLDFHAWQLCIADALNAVTRDARRLQTDASREALR